MTSICEGVHGNFQTDRDNLRSFSFKILFEVGLTNLSQSGRILLRGSKIGRPWEALLSHSIEYILANFRIAICNKLSPTSYSQNEELKKKPFFQFPCGQCIQQGIRTVNQERKSSKNSSRIISKTRYSLFLEAVFCVSIICPDRC